MTIVATAPGKLMLLGEYAVLEGGPALVAAVDRRARVSVASGSGRVRCRGVVDLDATLRWEGQRLVSEPDVPAMGLVRMVVQELCANAPFHLDVHVDTSAFQAEQHKLGLGSSASVTVALTAALLRAGDKPHDAESVAQHALRLHRLFQAGRGSGADILASAHGGALVLEPSAAGAPWRRLGWPASLALRVYWTGSSSSTVSLVGEVQRFARADPTGYTHVMAQLADASRAGIHALEAPDVSATLDAWQRYGGLMQALGEAARVEIVTPAMASHARLALAARGAYKPSGAGGGDVCVCVAAQADMAQVVAALRPVAGDPLPIELDKTGVETHVES